MKIKDRQGNICTEEDGCKRLVNDIYSNPVSRFCMRILALPFVSRAAGLLLDTSLSARLIPRFFGSVDISDCERTEISDYRSFNDFFTRRLACGAREICPDSGVLVCPSDGKVSAYTISDSDMFVIKDSVYTIASLLRDRKLAKKYSGGTALIIRLTPDDCHRYIYPTDGVKSRCRRIKGSLHTVRPDVNKYLPVYKENSREYCLIRSEQFGDIVQMEVGALLIGRIHNHERNATAVKKGSEKGYFEFGGSTIVLLLEKGRAGGCEDLLTATSQGYETKLKMGEELCRS